MVSTQLNKRKTFQLIRAMMTDLDLVIAIMNGPTPPHATPEHTAAMNALDTWQRSQLPTDHPAFLSKETADAAMAAFVTIWRQARFLCPAPATVKWNVAEPEGQKMHLEEYQAFEAEWKARNTPLPQVAAVPEGQAKMKKIDTFRAELESIDWGIVCSAT